MKKFLVLPILLYLTGCGVDTNSILQSNETAVTVMNRAGGFGDRGYGLAAKHCEKYGKVAVYESSIGRTHERKFTYLCK